MKFIPRSRLEAFYSLPADSLVRVYSYQEIEALERIETLGYLTGPSEENVDRFFKPAYDWMREQMATRVPDYSGEYPVWAWLKRPSTKNKERRYRGTETHKVRIIAKVPKKRILLSDYDRWHMPLNNSPCTRTESEYDLWQGDPRPSWEQVFDFTPWKTEEEISWLGSPDRMIVQACIDRIYAEEIISIRL